jgi:hypothetical protein
MKLKIMNKMILAISVSASLTSINIVKADTIFSCVTTNNKKIAVNSFDKYIEYKFGQDLENPELALSVPRDQASTWQWNGVGREMSYSVTVPNGAYDYIVFFLVDRISDDHPVTSGVTIEMNQKVISTVYCLSDTLVQSLEGIDLKENY